MFTRLRAMVCEIRLLRAYATAAAPAERSALPPSFSFAPQTVTITGENIGGLAFIANPPIVPTSYTLGPWTLIGPGVVTNRRSPSVCRATVCLQ